MSPPRTRWSSSRSPSRAGLGAAEVRRGTSTKRSPKGLHSRHDGVPLMYARGVASLDGATPRYRGRPEGQDPKGTPGKPTETSKAVRSGGLRRWGGGVLRYALAGSLADDANLRR